MKFSLVLKALSHPIRRDIVEHLKNGPMTAGQLAEKFDVSKPTMSTHFAALKEADLVTTERAGASIHYHLNATVADEAVTAMMQLLQVGNVDASLRSPIKSKRGPA